MLKYMLDTNIVIYIIKNRPVELVDVFNKNAGALCISTITLAELNHGVEKSSRPEGLRIEDWTLWE
jgi:tRNA(fMet)-specific endonuclease VapC